MIDNYLDMLIEANDTKARIPWRSGNIPIGFGKTDVKGLPQNCLLLNNLKFIMKLNPSLMLIIPKIEAIKKVGGATNGWLVSARKAQQLEFNELEKGTCSAKTYFFGRAKEGRTLDWVQRIGERGFSIENINGLKVFGPNSKIEFTVSKKDFSMASFFTGKQYPIGVSKKKDKAATTDDSKFFVPMRIKRIK
jgi:hypothetical protein